VTDAATLYGSVTYRDTQAATPTTGTEVRQQRANRALRHDARPDMPVQGRIPAARHGRSAPGVVPDVATGGKQ
jgi:hypothetical protein